MKILIAVVVIVVVLLLISLALAVRVVKQYEKGVLFRLGRVLRAREPGLRVIIPFADVLHRVTLRKVVGSTWPASRPPQPPRSGPPH